MRKFSAVLLAAPLLASACGNPPVAKVTPKPTQHPTPTATPVPTPTPTPPPPTPSPIPISNAPLIVQVENSDAARPQSGLSTADLIVEYTTEGGITRFSTIFFQPPPAGTQVGPVRSARLATVHLAQLLHGVLAYSGASTYINDQLSAAGVLHYDETGASGDLFRIDLRAAPHNLYSDGAHLGDLRAKAAAPPVAYTAWLRGAPPPAAPATPAPGFTVSMSNSEQPHFAWDPAHNAYTRTEPSTGPMIDANTVQPLLIPTVVVMQVDVRTAPEVHDVNGVLGLDHTLTGSGPAQVFTAGNQFDATWTEPGSGGLFALTLADGTQAPIAPGLVMICLVPKGQPAQVG
jgi:hypothetical protein